MTLQVVFKGTLGNEANIAVAIGTKDLSEPTHHVIWNLTDMYSLYDNLYTAAEIRANKGGLTPTLLSQAGAAKIDPSDITFTIGYTGDPNSTTFSPEVATAVLPNGRHMRLIGIFDVEKANYMELRWSGLGVDSYNVISIPRAINQDYDKWYSSPEATPYRYSLDGASKRSFMQHFNTGVLRCNPMSYDVDGKAHCSYPVEQAIPAVKAPFEAAIE